MNKILSTRKLYIVQNSKGQFLDIDYNGKVNWTYDPFRANNYYGLSYFRDVDKFDPTHVLVEIEVTAKMTGRTEVELVNDHGDLNYDDDEDF